MANDGLEALPGHAELDRLVAAAFRYAKESVLITEARLEKPGPRILYANFGFETITGYSSEEVIGKTPRILQGPKTDRAVLDRLVRQLSAGEHFLGETVNYRKDGTPFWLEWQISPVRNESGDVTHFVALQRDVTERKRGEIAVRESEQALRLITDSLPVLISEVGRDGILRFANRALAERLGRDVNDVVGRLASEILGRDVADEMHPYLVRALEGETLSFEVEQERLDGSKWAGLSHFVPRRDEQAEVDSVFSLTTDVTELKKAEEERRQFESKLHQAQRLESLGVFASGIAHDFNNVLAAVLGLTSVSLHQVAEDSELAENLRNVQVAAERGAELVREVLDYVGGTELLTEVTELPPIVEGMSKLLGACCSKRVKLAYELDPATPRIRGGATELRQILMNLVTNASESLESDAGTIRVRTGGVELSRKALDDFMLGEELPVGNYSFLEVSDDGPGIPEETRSRIFDPYFTSKPSGRGLGLAIVLGLVRSHGGALDLKSGPEGTRFRVLFPAASAGVDQGASRDSGAPVLPELPAGAVLFIDDEAGVRTLAGNALPLLGMEALTAANATEGIELLRRSDQAVLAIILDLSMPGIPVEDAITELRRVRPEAPIVMTSGFPRNRCDALMAREGVSGFLHKPFNLVEFANVLHDACRGGSAGPMV